jgi:inactive STAND
MSFRRRLRKSDTDALWRELARLVGLSGSSERPDVVARVVERLATQHVVIILTDLDRVDFNDCIDQFWTHLASAATEARAARSLVLVLVDFDGETRVGTSDTPALLWIRPLSTGDISAWLRALADDCPLGLLEAHEAAAHEIIAAASEHNPDGVLEEICARSEWNAPQCHLEEWFAI